MRRIRVALTAVAIVVLATGGLRARADAALLMEEPYAEFGAFNPTGHAAIYLNHICAESPTRLRHCHAGEPGAVISRYHKIDGFDWLAIPLVPYLYAVERVEDVPSTADATLEASVTGDGICWLSRRMFPMGERRAMLRMASGRN